MNASKPPSMVQKSPESTRLAGVHCEISNATHAQQTLRDGETNNGTVILVHGSESHAGWFSKIAQNLNKMGYRTVAYDRFGWGSSPGQRGKGLPLKALVNQLVELAANEAKHSPRIHIVGLSWGGLFVTEALRQGELKLCTTVTALVPGIFSTIHFSIFSRLKIFMAGIAYAIFHSQNLFNPLIELPWQAKDFSNRPETIEKIERDPLRIRAVSALFLWDTYLAQRRISSRSNSLCLEKLQFVLADNDRIICNDSLIKFANQMNIRFKKIPETSHAIVLDAPDSVARLIDDFAKASIL